MTSPALRDFVIDRTVHGYVVRTRGSCVDLAGPFPDRAAAVAARAELAGDGQDPDELVTVEEAARLAIVKPETIRILLMRDQLRATRTGAFEVRIRRGDLEAVRRRKA
jgi:excisionase family DNA binding protein